MALHYPLIDAADTPPEPEAEKNGFSISQFRLPIGARQGSSTAAYHALFGPESFRARHRHANCDEFAIYLSGGGVIGQGQTRTQVRAGHCQWIPKGTEHFFAHRAGGEDTLVVGFFIGAPDLAATGHEFIGEAGAPELDDLDAAPAAVTEGTLVHLDDVEPANMDQGDGWSITDFRLPIGGHSGASSTLFRARFFPGSVHKKHRHDNCDEIYYVISGHGLAGAGADRVEVHGGHFHYIPAGVEHWLHNLSDTEPLEVAGIYVGAGGVAATGYAFMGEVTAEDLGGRGN